MLMDLSALSSLAGILSEAFIDPRGDVGGRMAALLQLLPKSAETQALRETLNVMATAQEPREEREAEFVRLFQHSAGLRCAHPYESVYTHGRMMAPERISALESIFGDAGLKPQDDLHIPLDHIGLELEALSYFLAGMAEAGSSAEEERKWRSLASRLVHDHLLPFSKAFVGKLDEAKPGPYFKAAAEALSILMPLAAEAATGRC